MLVMVDSCCGDGKLLSVHCPTEKLADFKKFLDNLETEYNKHWLKSRKLHNEIEQKFYDYCNKHGLTIYN